MATRARKTARTKESEASARAPRLDNQQRTGRRWLQWFLSQGKSDKAERHALHLTQRGIGKALGVSDRAIRHYLASPDDPDYRRMPEGFLERLDAYREEKVGQLALRRSMLDEREGVEGYRPANLPLPLRMKRWERGRVIEGRPTLSEIITVDVRSLHQDEIEAVMRAYWHKLRSLDKQRKWDFRLLAKVRTQEYFEGEVSDFRIADQARVRDVRASIRDREEMYIWIPRDRAQSLFIGPKVYTPQIPIDNYRALLREYAERIESIEEVAFIPYKKEEKRKPARKRRYRR